MKTHGRPWADYIYILGRTEPAPTVSGSPCRACRMKLLTTRPSFMCMRGPKVLKILATRTSTPSWNREKRSERTPESATLPPCLHYPAHEAHHKTRFTTKSRWLFSDCMMCSLHTNLETTQTQYQARMGPRSHHQKSTSLHILGENPRAN